MTNNLLKNKNKKINATFLSYLSIWFVVFLWGVGPLINLYLYNYFSPVVNTSLTAIISTLSLLIFCLPNLKKLSTKYLKIAIPTGLCNAIANLLQKIGLNYTTPTNYAFLENLSSVVIPIIVFILVKKKPNIITLISIGLCVLSATILSGSNLFSSGKLNIGDLLCAIAGLLYGFNIAITGLYAKDLDAPLYVLVQFIVKCIFTLLSLLILSKITFNGKAVEQIYAIWNVKAIILLVAVSILSHSVCWVLRTFASKHISPTTLGLIMPCSAIVSTIFSIIFKLDSLTFSVIIGSILGMASAWLPSISELVVAKKKNN